MVWVNNITDCFSQLQSSVCLLQTFDILENILWSSLLSALTDSSSSSSGSGTMMNGINLRRKLPEKRSALSPKWYLEKQKVRIQVPWSDRHYWSSVDWIEMHSRLTFWHSCQRKEPKMNSWKKYIYPDSGQNDRLDHDTKMMRKEERSFSLCHHKEFALWSLFDHQVKERKSSLSLFNNKMSLFPLSVSLDHFHLCSLWEHHLLLKIQRSDRSWWCPSCSRTRENNFFCLS